jgi:hypothetical protein
MKISKFRKERYDYFRFATGHGSDRFRLLIVMVYYFCFESVKLRQINLTDLFHDHPTWKPTPVSFVVSVAGWWLCGQCEHGISSTSTLQIKNQQINHVADGFTVLTVLLHQSTRW